MTENSILTGSICLSDIPREQMKKVKCRDGVERVFLNVAVIARKTPQTFDDGDRKRTLTHFISCSPKKEERIDGVKYIIGDLETRTFGLAPAQLPSVSDIDNAPTADDSDLPF